MVGGFLPMEAELEREPSALTGEGDMKIRGRFFMAIAAPTTVAVACLLSGSEWAVAQPRANINQATLEQPGQRVREISTEELKALMAAPQPAVLIDVRPALQYALAHIPGAVNVTPPAVPSQEASPAAEEDTIARTYPDKATVLILYCAGPY
jgi:rhodanese-related sulfurtransferase